MCRHCPAHDLPAPGIQNHGEKEESRPGRYVGDVGHPESIRTRDVEVPLDQIRCRTGLRTPYCRTKTFPTTYALQASCLHQTSHPLAADSDSLLVKLEMNSGNPVGPSRVFMNLTDPLRQRRVGHAPGRRRSLDPRVVPAGGDAQRPAHHPNPVLGLVALHELEDFSGTEPASRANQAAAFARISRS